MKKYSNRYMATCVPGMEFVAADEIKEVIKNINNLSVTRGKVIFDRYQLADFNNLKCIDNLYKLYRTFFVGSRKADLLEIGRYLKDIDFDMSGKAPSRIIVSAGRSGKHTYSRYDISNQVENILVSTGNFIIGDNLNHDLAVRVDIIDNSCVIYKQLTHSEMRFRGDNFNTAQGGIRPPLAHCLVRLSQPKNDDIFYDPFCGAGTIPFERLNYKSKKIFASDYNNDVLEIARRNLSKSVIVFCADAVKSNMKDNSVDKIVTNMPWGKQIAVENIDILYLDFLKEVKRILTVNGKAVILTDQTVITENLCNELELNCSRITELSLHGLHPVVFMISKHGEVN